MDITQKTKGDDMEWLVSDHTHQLRKCIKCSKGELDSRMHRPVLFKFFLGWLPLKRYQCSKCKRRVYIWIK